MNGRTSILQTVLAGRFSRHSRFERFRRFYGLLLLLFFLLPEFVVSSHDIAPPGGIKIVLVNIFTGIVHLVHYLIKHLCISFCNSHSCAIAIYLCEKRVFISFLHFLCEIRDVVVFFDNMADFRQRTAKIFLTGRNSTIRKKRFIRSGRRVTGSVGRTDYP